ncbi:hypothetical protein QPK87_25850 [Kamptonema cortianum]|nr:hypothetical protein [Oscillatoria laete-virens]MDK3159959.1 hypothetical protein [Kamptonema cortianum]MDL5047200.1 hypothetical protein [Oscillatoria amoena NRMC-F 0135]MDL5055468.1 hypothetical protein [Oscillatoria laete-virens NRMC-F 0139]
MKINIHEAKTHLSRYAAMVKKGETIILCDRNIPFAEIRPLSSGLKRNAKKRPMGIYRGMISPTKDFEWTDEEIAEIFDGQISGHSSSP